MGPEMAMMVPGFPGGGGGMGSVPPQMRSSLMAMMTERMGDAAMSSPEPRSMAQFKLMPAYRGLRMAQRRGISRLPVHQARGWTLSWSCFDPPQSVTGQTPNWVLSVSDCGGGHPQTTVQRRGLPSVATVLQAFRQAATDPGAGAAPYLPGFVLLAHRMRGQYSELKRELTALGVRQVVLETRFEAQLTATAHGTDPEGNNYSSDEEA